MYSVEIEVIENGEKSRCKVCPSGGEPYRFKTKDEAFNAGHGTYGVNFVPFWVVEA